MRKRVSKGQIIIKKEEKLARIFDIMPEGYTEEDFINKFKEEFPKDWERIVKRYNEHERLTPKGKSHPMAEPKKYLLNAMKVYIKKNKSPNN